MKRTTVRAAARALPGIVDEVVESGRSTVLVRRGRPIAAIVPLVRQERRATRRMAMSAADRRALWAAFGDGPTGMVADLLASRR